MRGTHLLSFIALAALIACDETTYSTTERCDVTVSALTPDAASPGDTVVITGKPMTTVWDTAITVDRTRAKLQSVDREGCDACDTCREDNYCTVCADCDVCDAICADECVETATFTVPSGVSGALPVRLFNVHGQSDPLTLNVTALDTGTPETGTPETGTHETGTPETGSTETGTTETGSSETGSTETGSTETGSTETGSTETGG